MMQRILDEAEEEFSTLFLYKNIKNITYISLTRAFTLKRMEQFPDLVDFYIRSNPNITLKYVQDNIDLTDRRIIPALNKNVALSIEDLKKIDNPYIYEYKNKNYVYTDANKYIIVSPVPTYVKISIKDIDDCKYLRRDLCGSISENTTINITFIKHFKDRLDWYKVSEYADITMEDIKANLDLPWNFKRLSVHRNLTFKFVVEHKHFPWDWEMLISYGNINRKEYLKYKKIIRPYIPYGCSESYDIMLRKHLIDIYIVSIIVNPSCHILHL